MKIAIGCDHAGIDLKPCVIKELERRKIEYKDFGTYNTDSVDYPEYGLKVAQAVASGEYDKGIILCGTGIGISIAANKVPGIRAALVTSEFAAEATRSHNDSNILSMGSRVTTPQEAVKYLQIWLDTEFSGGKHKVRIDKITDIEKIYNK